jgi:hypothetical protein
MLVVKTTDKTKDNIIGSIIMEGHIRMNTDMVIICIIEDMNIKDIIIDINGKDITEDIDIHMNMDSIIMIEMII